MKTKLCGIEPWRHKIRLSQDSLALEALESTAESRDAMARISAHKTVLGQAFSRAALMASITSKPLAEQNFAAASFSVSMPVALSSRIDASHPYHPIPANISKSSSLHRAGHDRRLEASVSYWQLHSGTP